MWLMGRVEKFPRSQKFTLGDRIVNISLDILDTLVEATYTRKRLPLLHKANVQLEKLRYLIRNGNLLSGVPSEFVQNTNPGVSVNLTGIFNVLEFNPKKESNHDAKNTCKHSYPHPHPQHDPFEGPRNR